MKTGIHRFSLVGLGVIGGLVFTTGCMTAPREEPATKRESADSARTIRFKPESPEAWYHRGNVSLQMREYKSAIRDYNRAILIKPDHFEAVYHRGNAFKHLQDYRTAIRDYNWAIMINPFHSGAVLNRVDAHLALGNRKRALADLENVLETAPTEWPSREKVKERLDQLRRES